MLLQPLNYLAAQASGLSAKHVIVRTLEYTSLVTRRSEHESDAKKSEVPVLLNVWWLYPRDAPLGDTCDLTALIRRNPSSLFRAFSSTVELSF